MRRTSWQSRTSSLAWPPDNAATADKYAKIQEALYAETGSAAMKAADQAAAAAEKSAKGQIGSLEGQNKSDLADKQFKELQASMQNQVAAVSTDDSILAGLNQMIMMALAMVVTASMIGARGLGEEVLNGIQSLDVGKGLEAGLAIVVLAMALDRTSHALVARRGGARG